MKTITVINSKGRLARYYGHWLGDGEGKEERLIDNICKAAQTILSVLNTMFTCYVSSVQLTVLIG